MSHRLFAFIVDDPRITFEVRLPPIDTALRIKLSPRHVTAINK